MGLIISEDRAKLEKYSTKGKYMKRSATADLPLHGGHVPPWLANRMTELGTAISEHIVLEYGASDCLTLSWRWLVEKTFGWLKQTGPLRQVKLRGLAKVDWLFVFSCAAHNLMRLPRLIAQGQAEGLRQQCA